MRLSSAIIGSIIRLSDYSPIARNRCLARAKQFHEALKKFDDYKQLTGANQVDVRILRENVENEIFELSELKEPDWNPLVYNQSLANGLYLLVARDFDAAEKRIASLRGRLDAIPRVIEQAKAKSATSAASSHRNRDRAGPRVRSIWCGTDSIRC